MARYPDVAALQLGRSHRLRLADRPVLLLMPPSLFHITHVKNSASSAPSAWRGPLTPMSNRTLEVRSSLPLSLLAAGW